MRRGPCVDRCPARVDRASAPTRFAMPASSPTAWCEIVGPWTAARSAPSAATSASSALEFPPSTARTRRRASLRRCSHGSASTVGEPGTASVGMHVVGSSSTRTNSAPASRSRATIPGCAASVRSGQVWRSDDAAVAVRRARRRRSSPRRSAPAARLGQSTPGDVPADVAIARRSHDSLHALVAGARAERAAEPRPRDRRRSPR